ncbi:MAG: Maf family protein [Alphaproteobacteria bacterium]
MTRPTTNVEGKTRAILASASAARAKLLQSAGVPVEIIPAQIDETALRANFSAAAATADFAQHLAQHLAQAKALHVSDRSPNRLVIGADQILECGEEIFEKPTDMAQARVQLCQLRARSHNLHSAVALVRDGEILWHHVASAQMEMRDFSDGFLDEYLMQAGEKICTSVGAYQIEGLGVQLFKRISGDFFTILGLPLLPLLDALRTNDALRTDELGAR